jgi:hypothetical protein
MQWLTSDDDAYSGLRRVDYAYNMFCSGAHQQNKVFTGTGNVPLDNIIARRTSSVVMPAFHCVGAQIISKIKELPSANQVKKP